MVGNNPIKALADGGGARHVLVRPQGQPPSGKRRCFEHRARAFDDSSIGLDELDGARTAFARQIGEAFSEGGILEGQVLDGVAGPEAPPRDPVPTEPTIAVENEHRNRGRRTGWPGISHAAPTPRVSLGPTDLQPLRQQAAQAEGLS